MTPTYVVYFPHVELPYRIKAETLHDLFRSIEQWVARHGPFDLVYRVY